MRGFIKLVVGVIERFNWCLCNIASFILAYMVCMVVGQVVMRYGAGRGLSWVQDGISFSFVPLIALPLGYVLMKGGHINVEVVIMRLRPGAYRIVEVFNSVLTLFCAIIMIYFGSIKTWSAFVIGQHSEYSLFPFWIVFLAVPLGFFGLSLQGSIDLVRAISRFKNKGQKSHINFI